METEFLVQCPFCKEIIWIEFYPKGSTSQESFIKCSNCSATIPLEVKYDPKGRAQVLVEQF
jgi:Cysteine-rich CPXCG